jgi:hypothetical protein
MGICPSIDAKSNAEVQRNPRDPSLKRHLNILGERNRGPYKGHSADKMQIENQVKRGERLGREISSVDISVPVRMDEPRREVVHGLFETRRTLGCHVSRVHRWEIPGI